jgi:hypothetical protein
LPFDLSSLDGHTLVNAEIVPLLPTTYRRLTFATKRGDLSRPAEGCRRSKNDSPE